MELKPLYGKPMTGVLMTGKLTNHLLQSNAKNGFHFSQVLFKYGNRRINRLHYHGLDVEVQKYKVILYADDQFLMIINKTT